MQDSTVYPQPSIALLLTSDPGKKFYLSVIESEEENKYVVITKVSELIIHCTLCILFNLMFRFFSLLFFGCTIYAILQGVYILQI